MSLQKEFDISIKSDKKISKPLANNIAEIIFTKLSHRNENCDIIWSHDNEKFIKISLKRLRYIVTCLFKEFKTKNIQPGDSVILADIMVNNVCFIAIMFTAFASYGCRVMLPMWVETSEISSWINMTNCKSIIAPEKEIDNLSRHEKEKKILKMLKSSAREAQTPFYDIEKDFKIRSYLYKPIPKNFSALNNQIVKEVIRKTNSGTEIGIFTTSGTSGRSKLVVYDQGAYLRTIAAYEASGLYKEDKMGGRSFIDIFMHTLSVRNLMNAIWTGYPICMVISDWIKKKPEKVLPFLIKMKPEVITIGPSSFSIVIDFIKTFPEIRKKVFSDLKTIVSTGASYSCKTAKEYKQITGLTLHNAYGLVETQQFLTTVLCDTELDILNPCLGKPIAGVEIGLKKFNEDTYKLFVKTTFDHKYLINPDGQKLVYPDEFLDTGDIVRIDSDQNIYYIGREDRDFFKNGFGAKIPISIMKKYYKTLYEQVEHIEYYAAETSMISLGVAALIFINDKNIPVGRVTQKKVIKKFKKIIKSINRHLYKKIEPFEYDNRAITRFLLINNNVPKTRKDTVSKYTIETELKKEINDLKKPNLKKDGAVTILRPNQAFFNFLLKFFPFKSATFRKVLLKIINVDRGIS